MILNQIKVLLSYRQNITLKAEIMKKLSIILAAFIAMVAIEANAQKFALSFRSINAE